MHTAIIIRPCFVMLELIFMYEREKEDTFLLRSSPFSLLILVSAAVRVVPAPQRVCASVFCFRLFCSVLPCVCSIDSVVDKLLILPAYQYLVLVIQTTMIYKRSSTHLFLIVCLKLIIILSKHDTSS